MASIPVNKTEKLIAAIIKVADERFRADGFDETKVESIAKDTGISTGALYELFRSKEEILRELAWRCVCGNYELFLDTFDEIPPPDDMLLGFCKNIFTDRVRSGRDGIFHGLYSSEPEIQQAWYDAIKRILSTIYEQGKERGMFKPNDSAFMAASIAGMIRTSTDYFPRVSQPVHMFNDTLLLLADMVSYKERVKFNRLG